MKEKVSIVVPVYNVEKELKYCLDSLVKQTYKNIEIILVNDGSTDNSKKICEEYKKKYKNIILINKKNGGLSSARNEGIKKATGKYISFVDSDDFLHIKTTEILMNNLNQTNSDISCCNYAKIYNYDNLQNEIKNELTTYSNKDAMKELLIDEKINDFAWNKIYKIELFENIEFPIGKKMEDIGTTYKVFNKCQKVVHSNFIGYYYLQRNNSISNSISESLLKDYIQMIDNKIDFYFKNHTDLHEETKTLYVTSIINFHNACIKSKLKNIYFSDKMNEYYEYIKKCNKTIIEKIIKKQNIKRKIIIRLLLFNKKTAYYCFNIFNFMR